MFQSNWTENKKVMKSKVKCTLLLLYLTERVVDLIEFVDELKQGHVQEQRDEDGLDLGCCYRR